MHTAEVKSIPTWPIPYMMKYCLEARQDPLHDEVLPGGEAGSLT